MLPLQKATVQPLIMLSSRAFQCLCVIAVIISGVSALVDPTEVYNGGYPEADPKNPLLRIATGGAGQSGLVKGTLCYSSTKYHVNNIYSSRRRIHKRQRKERFKTIHHRLGRLPQIFHVPS